MLELSNGEVYFIECVWERDSHAGFRFAAPIDVHAFIAEVSPYARRLMRLRLQFPVLLTVDVRTEEESLRLMVADAMALDQAVASTAAGLKIYLREKEPLASIQQILNRAPKGKGKVQIALDLADAGLETDVTVKGGFSISPAIRGAIKAIPGVADLQDI